MPTEKKGPVMILVTPENQIEVLEFKNDCAQMFPDVSGLLGGLTAVYHSCALFDPFYLLAKRQDGARDLPHNRLAEILMSKPIYGSVLICRFGTPGTGECVHDGLDTEDINAILAMLNGFKNIFGRIRFKGKQ
jgi:hypothetical protein